MSSLYYNINIHQYFYGLLLFTSNALAVPVVGLTPLNGILYYKLDICR